MDLIRKLNELDGKDVIAVLKEHASNLPAEGLASGQATASAVLALLGLEGCGVFNDVDVFVHDPKADVSTNLLRQELDRGPLPAHVWIQAAGVYSGVFASEDSVLFINSVRYEGRVNLIGCQMRDNQVVPWCDGVKAPQGCAQGEFRACEHLAQSALVPHLLLKSLDLNCVQAAVDLQTGDLHWTREFEAFVQSREIRMTNVGTPLRTVVRALEKARQMPGAYFNEAAAIAQAHLRFSAARNPSGLESSVMDSLWTGTQLGLSRPEFEWQDNLLCPDIGARTNNRMMLFEVMGPERAARFKPFAHKLKPWLDLAPMPIDEPQGIPGPAGRKPSAEERAAQVPTYAVMPQRAVPQAFEQSLCAVLGPEACSLLGTASGRFRLAEAVLHPLARRHALRFHAALAAGASDSRRSTHVKAWALRMVDMHGLAFFDRDATAHQYRAMAEAVHGHAAGLEMLDRVSLQLQACDMLAELGRVRPVLGLAIFGLAENRSVCLCRLTRDGRYRPVTLEALLRVVDDVLERADQGRATKLDTSCACDVHIEHLTQAAQLLAEGARMHHCVGGYAFGGLREKEFIFAATHVPTGTRVTVQCLRMPPVWYGDGSPAASSQVFMAQCFAAYNKQVDATVRAAVQVALSEIFARANLTLSVRADAFSAAQPAPAVAFDGDDDWFEF